MFGYEMEKGTMTMKFPALHEASIISMAYLPEQEVLITSTVDSGGTVGVEVKCENTGSTYHQHCRLRGGGRCGAQA